MRKYEFFVTGDEPSSRRGSGLRPPVGLWLRGFGGRGACCALCFAGVLSSCHLRSSRRGEVPAALPLCAA
ncbi:MAG: hypothetical protein RR115_08525 [Hydrogenoanaerobacterium sp.]